MSTRGNLVNLDAMISRADFALEGASPTAVETVHSISLRDFIPGALIGPILRKPDFQRETNHWTPEQVVSLLECYVNGDLIPSVILWKSPQYLFVIDGGHRLSVLRAWALDDYGDGAISQAFFGYRVSEEQRAVAERTRRSVADRVGSWQQLQSLSQAEDAPTLERQRFNSVVSRALPIQWVVGNADRAESSFFKINTEGTPLDSIEELLLRNRRRPIPIAARAIIRAGKGHRYWSSFPAPVTTTIEEKASELNSVLFEPELQRPVKTLDLPLGGSQSIRVALEVLIDFMLISCRDQGGNPRRVDDQAEDSDGSGTLKALDRALRLARRITGNDRGSLGLHPAVYFYGPTRRHSGPMFMGTVALIGRKLANNDQTFFRKFTEVRERLETVLISHKELIAAILQKHSSKKRNGAYESLLGGMLERLETREPVSEQWLVDYSGLRGKLVTGTSAGLAERFTEDTKSEIFMSAALKNALRCPVCQGYLDVEKSVSYDHIERVRDGGGGQPENCQMTHPFCNQGIRA